MEFKELIYRVLLELQVLIPLIITILAVTFLLLVFLLIKYKTLKFDNSKKGSVGLFFGLSKINSLQLALVYLKALVIAYYAIAFRELKIIDYIAIGLPCILFSFIDNKPLKILENLFWTAIQVLGLIACKVVFTYAFKEGSSIYLKILYFGLVIITFIYTLYLFWNDILNISNKRDITPQEIFVIKKESETNNEEK